MIRSLAMVMMMMLALVPIASCDNFSIHVTPEYIEDAIAGQRCVFLVAVEPGNKPIHISATINGTAGLTYPQETVPGQIAEVTVIPSEASVGKR